MVTDSETENPETITIRADILQAYLEGTFKGLGLSAWQTQAVKAVSFLRSVAQQTLIQR